MINLLPPAEKKQLKAGKVNIILLRYCLILVAATIFLGLAIGGTLFVLKGNEATAQARIDENNSKVGQLAAVQAQANNLRASLATAKTILDKEIAYSKVVLNIAQTLPAGVVLDTLTLDANTFGTPITLNVKAKSPQAAIQLKEALQRSPFFSNVSFQSVSTAEAASDYPTAVVLSLTINKEIAK